MKATVLDEPELEFAGGNRHIDPRYGIVDYGPADAGGPRAPTEIRVGLVGDAESIEGIRGWLERCSAEIPGKPSPLAHLFPPFPGFAEDRAFQARLLFDPRFERVLAVRRYAPWPIVRRRRRSPRRSTCTPANLRC